MMKPGGSAEALSKAERKRERDNLGIEIVSGPCKGEAPFIAKTGQVTIGRTSKNNLHIKDFSISQKHAELEWMDDGWTIQDKGSSNGTKVNGKPLKPAVKADADNPDCRVTLQDGDVILLGSETLVRVEIRPPIPDDMTVEQYLEQECKMLIKRIQARSQRSQTELREQAEQLKRQLRQAMPAV